MDLTIEEFMEILMFKLDDWECYDLGNVKKYWFKEIGKEKCY